MVVAALLSFAQGVPYSAGAYPTHTCLPSTGAPSIAAASSGVSVMLRLSFLSGPWLRLLAYKWYDRSPATVKPAPRQSPSLRRRRCQPACKPGSVWPSAPCGAENVAAIHLGPALPRRPHATYPDGEPETALSGRPSTAPIRFCSRWGLPVPLLLPSARWALTPPFHPYRSTPETPRRRFAFLWHFPWGRPRRTLSGTVFPWSPDFPHPQPFGSRRCGRPAGWQRV